MVLLTRSLTSFLITSPKDNPIPSTFVVLIWLYLLLGHLLDPVAEVCTDNRSFFRLDHLVSLKRPRTWGDFLNQAIPNGNISFYYFQLHLASWRGKVFYSLCSIRALHDPEGLGCGWIFFVSIILQATLGFFCSLFTLSELDGDVSRTSIQSIQRMQLSE